MLEAKWSTGGQLLPHWKVTGARRFRGIHATQVAPVSVNPGCDMRSTLASCGWGRPSSHCLVARKCSPYLYQSPTSNNAKLARSSLWRPRLAASPTATSSYLRWVADTSVKARPRGTDPQRHRSRVVQEELAGNFTRPTNGRSDQAREGYTRLSLRDVQPETRQQFARVSGVRPDPSFAAQNSFTG